MQVLSHWTRPSVVSDHFTSSLPTAIGFPCRVSSFRFPVSSLQMLHHKSSPQATRSRAHTLAHSLHQLLAPLKLRHSHSHCVQYRYRDRDARFKCHTMPGLPCLALLLFLRAVLIRRILARIDARQQRLLARQAQRATNADHSHFLGHANCALLAGRPISNRCGRPPRLPAGFNPSSRF